MLHFLHSIFFEKEGVLMPYKTVDLHCHSYYSDGTFSPEALVIEAKKRGLSALALTDHDTIDGICLFHEAGKKHHLETITGIEFAAEYTSFQKQEIHIIGLGFSTSSAAITETLTQMAISRQKRNEKMVFALNRLGFTISYDEIAQNAGGNIITRAHFANVLVKKGIVKTKQEAFEKYLSQGKPAYICREFLTPRFCIETIKKAGGVAILAHPTLYHMDDTQIEHLAKELKSYGLDGIETDYSTYSQKQKQTISKIAKRLELLPSGGSDFHGSNKTDIHLAIGRGNLQIPYYYWEELKKHCHII